MEKTRVLLVNGTVGDVVALLPDGKVDVSLRDENGMPITVIGEISEVLE